jgi:hypothetical protein
VVELADVLERFLELVVIAEPPAHVINLFAAQAELASTAAADQILLSYTSETRG